MYTGYANALYVWDTSSHSVLLCTVFYVGHAAMMKIHKVDNNCKLQLSPFCITYGFNAACFSPTRCHH
jgi:hypothetical protein